MSIATYNHIDNFVKRKEINSQTLILINRSFPVVLPHLFFSEVRKTAE